MKFAKTLMAAALLASAGSAQASIAAYTGTTQSTGLLNEAFLAVYDSSQALTYDLDLGVTLGTLIGTSATALHYTLNDANWKSFSANLNAATTSYGVVVGYATKAAFTSNNPAPMLAGGLTAETAVSGAMINDAKRINIGDATASSVNTSKLVANANADQGGWSSTAGGAATLDNLWGTFSLASAGIAYGSNGNFFYDTYASSAQQSKHLGYWNLSGNTLDYNLGAAPTPAAVPLPAAVWMFGAGLMGVLRLNRRKSAEV